MRPRQPERLPSPQLPRRRPHRRRVHTLAPSTTTGSASSTAASSPPSSTVTAQPAVMWEGRQLGWTDPAGAPVPFITASFDVKFRRPTPLGPTLRLTASARKRRPVPDHRQIRDSSRPQGDSNDESHLGSLPPPLSEPAHLLDIRAGSLHVPHGRACASGAHEARKPATDKRHHVVQTNVGQTKTQGVTLKCRREYSGYSGRPLCQTKT